MPLMFPKPRPQQLERDAQRKQSQSLDQAENAKVRWRSQGQCEVQELGRHGVARRCARRAGEIHHLLGGWGRRARGPSALAEHKLHVCKRCHREITGHALQPIGPEPRWTIRYRRIL